MLTANPRRDVLKLTIVDGFAGGGQYMRGGILVPGSPLIVLNEIEAAAACVNAQRTKPISIDSKFVFVEHKKANVEFLKALVQASPHASLIGDNLHIIHDSFENALPSIIKDIKFRGRAERAIFFLDQYGYSDVSFHTIRMILDQLANPEIILTFNVDWLIAYLSTDERFLKAVKPIELSLNDVRQMLHVKGQREARWFIQNILYKHLVQHTNARYYTPFFIKSTESHRAYWLVHISKHLKERGLTGVRLIISDACIGLAESAADYFPDAAWQRCVVHFYRNVFSHVPRPKMREVAAMLKAIHAAEDVHAAREKARQVVAKLREQRLTKAAELVETRIEETFAYYVFPEEHWRRIRTNNPLERILREIRRRTRVVGAFPDGESALNLAAARLRHVAGTEWSSKRYLSMEFLKDQQMGAVTA